MTVEAETNSTGSPCNAPTEDCKGQHHLHLDPSLHPTLLRVEDLVCGYGKTGILGPATFHLHAHTFMLIEGSNGSGKTTLLKTLLGLIPPVSGELSWKVPREALRFVPQTRTLDPMLPATVFDVLATGLHRGNGHRSLRVNIDRQALKRSLEMIRMEGFGHHLFRELSEGQKQLILVARALLGEPRVLLLDEPSASMDPEREAETVDLLHEIHSQSGVTVVMIAHGSTVARRASTRIMQIQRGGAIHIEECGDQCADKRPSQLN